MPDSGRLSIVGTGIRPGGQLTTEARHLIAAADQVLTVVDGLALNVLKAINPATESMQDCYAVGRQRDDSYAEMVSRLLAPLSQGKHVCGAFYGHPGVFVWPAQEAIRQARAAGHSANLYPGISAEDCLFADLGVDPAVHGCQSYEASDFLLYPRKIDPTAALILWQPAALGDHSRSTFKTDPAWVQVLADVLQADYPADHPVIIYEAATFPLEPPQIESVPLTQLHQARLSQLSTLYLAPKGPPRLSKDRLIRLGLKPEDLSLAEFQSARVKHQWTFQTGNRRSG